MRNIHAIALSVLLVLASCTYTKEPLRFHDGTFKIMQLTDIHWKTDTPGCDATRTVVAEAVAAEHPDLIVVTGDVSQAVDAERGWNEVLDMLDGTGVPYYVTMGNHDAEYLSKDKIYDLVEARPGAVSDRGPSDIHGRGNAALSILGKNGRPAAQVFCIDSNDYPADYLYSSYDWVRQDQIRWITKSSLGVPSVLFMHIAIPEMKEMVENETWYGIREDAFGCSDVNSGLFAACVENGSFLGMFFGHDHNSNLIGLHHSMALSYGRVTGADAAGSLERGCRIVLLHEGSRRMESWTRTLSGKGPVFYYPFGDTDEHDSSLLWHESTAEKTGDMARGVRYDYFEGIFNSVADMEGLPPVKSGTADGFDIGEAVSPDRFGFIFNALLEIDEDAEYRFYTFSDDGSVLYIDGIKVVDNDGPHSPAKKTGCIALRKGLHTIKAGFFEGLMGQELNIGYASREMEERPIPAEKLFLPR